MRKIIGICGAIGAGKDSAADHLVEKHQFVKESLAAPMKEMVRELFAIPPENLYGSQEQKAKPLWHLPKNDGLSHWSAREVLEFFGSDACRTINPNVWVNAMFRRLRETASDIVICDVRFQNEADMLRRLGGSVIRVVKSGSEEPGTQHFSGLWFKNAVVDHEIVAADLDQLYSKIDTFLKLS